MRLGSLGDPIHVRMQGRVNQATVLAVAAGGVHGASGVYGKQFVAAEHRRAGIPAAGTRSPG